MTGWARGPGRSEVGGRPVGVELLQERGAALGLVGLADRLGLPPQPVERPQEPPVLLVLPPDVAPAPPAAGPEPVEAPVVADAVVGVALDRVAAEVAQPGPGLEVAGPPGHHLGHGLAVTGRQGLLERRP